MKKTFDLVPTKCVLCGDERSNLITCGTDRLEKIDGLFRVVECVSCGTWRLNPGPPTDHIAELYPESYDAYQRRETPSEAVIPGFTHRLRRRFVDWAVKDRRSVWTLPLTQLPRVLAARIFSRSKYGRFNPLAFHGEGRRVLDVGCATGDMLSHFRAHGWTPFGIESSPQAARLSVESGYKVETGRFPDDAALIRPYAPFSAILMSNVIEHLDDPFAALCEAYGLLEPGGFILVWTPVADGWIQKRMPQHWYNLDIPRHLHLFKRAGLAALLHQAGFQVLETWPCSSTRAVLRTFSHHFRSHKMEKTAAFLESNRRLLRVMNPIVRLMDSLGGGDVLLIMGWKPSGVFSGEGN